MRKVFLKVVMNLVIDMDEGVSVDDVLNELCVTTDQDVSCIADFEVDSHEITDSK